MSVDTEKIRRDLERKLTGVAFSYDKNGFMDAKDFLVRRGLWQNMRHFNAMNILDHANKLYKEEQHAKPS